MPCFAVSLSLQSRAGMQVSAAVAVAVFFFAHPTGLSSIAWSRQAIQGGSVSEREMLSVLAASVSFSVAAAAAAAIHMLPFNICISLPHFHLFLLIHSAHSSDITSSGGDAINLTHTQERERKCKSEEAPAEITSATRAGIPSVVHEVSSGNACPSLAAVLHGPAPFTTDAGNYLELQSMDAIAAANKAAARHQPHSINTPLSGDKREPVARAVLSVEATWLRLV